MPLIRRRPVPLLPIPAELEALDPQTPVFLLKATGEIFLDYPSYVARFSYLQSKIFQCEFSGKSGQDYFTALASERAESRVVRERFPDELKARVLSTVQFQVMGRLDALVELVYERYKDRFFACEKVFVDLSGDKYFARIAKVFPPALVRSTVTSTPQMPEASTFASTSMNALIDPVAKPQEEDYSSVSHCIGISLNVDIEDAKRDDDPEEYLYTVQLMDEEHKFEGSFMEVKGKSLSRDRLSFSKSILKRYIRECVQRDALIASPWIVKPHIAEALGISTEQDPEMERRNQEIREGKLAKRRKPRDDLIDVPAKRKKNNDPVTGENGTPETEHPSTTQRADPKRPVKYPIEDLDLDPYTIHDGRVLRRLKADPPPLPTKPIPSRHLLVPAELFDEFLMVWNCLNIFSKPLSIATFSMDDFAAALHHGTLKPRSLLLAEVHASLINVVSTDLSRVLGSTKAAPLPAHLTLGNVPRHDPLETASITSSSPAPDGTIAANTATADEEAELEDVKEVKMEADLGMEYELEEEEEIDRLVRKGILHAKRWDRLTKLKSADGRAGWERHMIGALCQRGGPLVMPNIVRILSHLFSPVDQLDKADDKPDLASLSVAVHESSASAEPEHPEVVDYSPELSYLSLDLEDKIDILSYLCTLALGSKLVRLYVEESETNLTEFRKERTEVNKERRRLLEERSIFEGGKPAKIESEQYANGMGEHAVPSPVAPRPVPQPILANAEEDEEDQLADDDSTAGDPPPAPRPVTPEPAPAPVAASPSKGAKGRSPAKKSKGKAVALVEPALPVGKSKSAVRKEADKIRQQLEDALAANIKKDDHVEREFRRNYGVARCRPLGKDRFFNRYWWFDGVGGMSLSPAVAAKSGGALFGTGRLFVQGPSPEDWDFACEREAEGDEGISILDKKREMENGVPEASLDVNEWAFYETEEQVEALLNWLNGKGVRELALKNAIAKWRGYIMAGCRKRLSGAKLAPPPRPPAPVVAPVVVQTLESRRGARGQPRASAAAPVAVVPAPAPVATDGPSYLNYQNTLGRL